MHFISYGSKNLKKKSYIYIYLNNSSVTLC